MNFSLSCFFLMGGFVLVLLYFILLLFSNHAVEKENRNSFLNSFPYLFYQAIPLSMRIFLYILLGGGMLLMGIGECLFFSGMAFTYYQTVLAFLFPLSFLFLYLSNLLPLNYYRAHLVFSVLGFFFFASSCVLTGLILFVSGATMDNSFYQPAIMITIGVIGLLCFAGLCNPKLADWTKMQKAEENGKTYYVKPKVNFYALYEWISLMMMSLVALLFFLNIFICGLVTMQ